MGYMSLICTPAPVSFHPHFGTCRHSLCVPVLLCPVSLCFYLIVHPFWRVMCPLTDCVLTSLCPHITVLQSHFVPVSLCPNLIETLSHCVPILTCHCVSVSFCPHLIVSQFQCVPHLIVSPSHCPTIILCPCPRCRMCPRVRNYWNF